MVSNIFNFHPYLGKIPILTKFSNGLRQPPTRDSGFRVSNILYFHPDPWGFMIQFHRGFNQWQLDWDGVQADYESGVLSCGC